MENQKKTFQSERSDELREIITKIPSWIIRHGNNVILVILLMILLLSYLIKYPETVSATVTITTLDPPQKIYTQFSGTLDSVFVENNALLRLNDPVAMFENAANYGNVQYLKELLLHTTLSSDSISFPIETLPMLALGTIEDSFSNFENSYINYILLKKYKDYDIRSLANRQYSEERHRKLANLKSQYQLHSKELELLQLDVKRNEQLYAKGVISKQSFERKEMEYLQSDKLAKNTLSEISELNDEATLSKQNSALNNVEKIRVERTLKKELYQNFDKLNISIQDWERTYLLKSPRDGTVTFLRNLKANDYLEEKQLIASVIPIKNLEPIAKLRTDITHSGKIKVGQRVHMMLDNFSYIEYGMLIGRVSNISLVPDDDNFYFIDVELDNDLITTYNKKLQFKHEMIGNAKIITQDKRLIERVLHQLKNLIIH